jgi:hypothetical protein
MITNKGVSLDELNNEVFKEPTKANIVDQEIAITVDGDDETYFVLQIIAKDDTVLRKMCEENKDFQFQLTTRDKWIEHDWDFVLDGTK